MFTRNPSMLVYRGTAHTVLEWSKITGLSTSTIRSRMSRGLSDEDVLKPSASRQGSRDILIEINGVLAPISKHAKARSLSAETVFQRIGRGATPEEALAVPAREYSSHLEYNGESKTIREWAEELEVTTACIYARLRLKHRIEEILAPKGSVLRVQKRLQKQLDLETAQQDVAAKGTMRCQD